MAHGAIQLVWLWPVTGSAIVYNSDGVETRVLSPFRQNAIYGNKRLQFVNTSASNVDATQNYWGTTDSTQISQGIYDHADNSTLGAVSYIPFRGAPDACAPLAPGAYTISGMITDSASNPISGVTVLVGPSGSAITDASGYYTITSAIMGTYTITPIGTTFSPASRTVRVPPSATGQDFRVTGTQPGAETPPVALPRSTERETDHSFGGEADEAFVGTLAAVNDLTEFQQAYLASAGQTQVLHIPITRILARPTASR